MKDCYVALDVGSNSLRSLLVRRKCSSLCYVESSTEITRITQGLKEGSRHLEETAVERTCRELGSLIRHFDALGVPETNRVFFATESLRSALNARVVMDRLEKTAKLPLRVFTGEEEAWFTSYGAVLAFPDAQGVFDLGGGSLELSCDSSNVSLPLGAVRMTNLFGEDVPELRKYLGEKLSSIQSFPQSLIGVGGTSSTLAMMLKNIAVERYEPGKIHGFRVERGALRACSQHLASLSLEGRKSVPGLPSKRADIILAGLVVLEEMLDFLGLSGYVHSECDLLWGVLRHHIEKAGTSIARGLF